MKGAFYPHLWKPLLQAGQTEVLDWFKFGDTPPSGELDFSGFIGDPRKFSLKGACAASALVYRGVDVDLLRMPDRASR